jgi:hypothetical protein
MIYRKGFDVFYADPIQLAKIATRKSRQWTTTLLDGGHVRKI